MTTNTFLHFWGCEGVSHQFHMQKARLYILDGLQMFGGILRDEAEDDLQSMVFSY